MNLLLAEELDLISGHMVDHNSLNSISRGPVPSSDLLWLRVCLWYICIPEDKKLVGIKIF